MATAQALDAARTKNRELSVLRALSSRLVVLRIGFGVVWAIDAYFKWQPSFVSMFTQYVTKAGQNQPGWLSPWFRFWKSLTSTSDPHLFAYSAAVIETLIAVCLIVGVGRRVVYLLGAAWSLAIWSVPEGFGPVFVPGASDIGAAIMYALIFLSLYWLESAVRPDGWTLDSAIRRRLPAWRRIGDPGGRAAFPIAASFSPRRRRPGAER